MPGNIDPSGSDKGAHHDQKAAAQHRVAARMEGVVKNKGTKKEKKEKK